MIGLSKGVDVASSGLDGQEWWSVAWGLGQCGLDMYDWIVSEDRDAVSIAPKETHICVSFGATVSICLERCD